MKINVGFIDRNFRIIIGLLLLVMTPGLGALLGYPLGMPFGKIAWIGIVPLITGLMGWCPPYSLLGISTCKANF